MRQRLRRLSVRDVRVVLAQKAIERDRWLRSAHPPTLYPSTHYALTHSVREAVERAGGQVHAMGVGRKIKDGKATDIPCVRFYVTRKLPKSLLTGDVRIPEILDGVPTDVIESPVAYLASGSTPPQCSIDKLNRQRPICPGISVANEGLLAGTLGAVCRSTVPGEEKGRYILGCRHVLQDRALQDGVSPDAAAGLAGGAAVLQPSAGDGGTGVDAIAQFVRAAPIDESASANNTVDAAIAILVDGVEASIDICGVGSIAGVGVPSHGAVVHKHGRTSGYTLGLIDDPAVDVLVPESEAPGASLARFIGQFRVVPTAGMSVFAQSGDSGALIVERKSQNAVGLLFACPRDGSYGFCNPIGEVLTALQIRLEI
jgi:hypothetical protein